MSNQCKTCDGCGKVSHRTGVPWNVFVGSDDDQDSIMVDNDEHRARTCPTCKGVGVKPRDSENDATP